MKWLKILGYTTLVILTIALALSLLFDVPARTEELLVIPKISKSEFTQRKKIPAKYEKQVLTALSYFPELHDDSIIFELTDYGAPLESTFVIGSLIRPWNERIYRILIREEGNGYYDPVLVKNLPNNSQIAIIAHELSHTLYYKRLHVGEIASWGLRYLVIPRYAQSHERFADEITVKRGLGYELLEYATFVRNVPEFKDEYQNGGLKWIDKYYLTPEEIGSLIRSHQSEVSE